MAFGAALSTILWTAGLVKVVAGGSVDDRRVVEEGLWIGRREVGR